MKSMIIDSHSHFMPEPIAQKTAFFKVNWSDIDKQLAVMDQLGIQKSLLLYPTSDAHLELGGWDKVCDLFNPAIADVARTHSGRFIPAGIVPVDNRDKMLPAVRQMNDLGVQVISLPSSYEGKYMDDPAFHPVYQFAADHRMVIHVHPQIMNPIGFQQVKDPLLTPVLEYMFDISICIGKMMMSGTLAQFSTVPFIFAHYGGVVPFLKERFDNTYAMLRGRDFVKDLGQSPSEYFANLYFDTSGSKSPAALQCALEVTDARHVLFGSDFPANQSIADSIAMIRESTLPERDQQAILANELLTNL
jgi:predicted TIM-barrel fold metal-dependent hydrolase